MKKILIVVVLVAVILTMLVGCTTVELNFGKKLVKTNDMITILTELTAGTADVGVMDSIMAGYYMSQDTNYASKLMIVENLVLAEEQYGIAARKEATSTIYQINKALLALSVNGKVLEVAESYGLVEDLDIDESYVLGEDASTDSDWATIQAKGKLKIGYTVFAPIAYTDDAGAFIGFDIDLAKAVGEYLGVQVEFVKIEWNGKELELSSGNIDLIWNGMTITDELKASMNISIPYLANKQVAIIRKADKDIYKDTDAMKDAIIVAESGSAGQGVVVKKKD
jgi:polar amino acid transport system substrate-binding protein